MRGSMACPYHPTQPYLLQVRRGASIAAGGTLPDGEDRGRWGRSGTGVSSPDLSPSLSPLKFHQTFPAKRTQTIAFPLSWKIYFLYFLDLAQIDRVALSRSLLLLTQEDKLLASNFQRFKSARVNQNLPAF